MCALSAGQLGKKVMVLDHAKKPGRKILISGGGRCNFTNLETEPDRFISDNPHFVKSPLAQYTQYDFIELVKRYRIEWHEKTLGQLFCNGSADQIVSMLLQECKIGNVKIKLDESITNIEKREKAFLVSSNRSIYRSNTVVIATGGPSIPKLGATGFAYDIAKQFGLSVVEPRPALVPLTISKDDALFTELSGVATDIIASNDKASFKEAALFTHKGLSGPAILQISSYWRQREQFEVNYLPGLPVGWLISAKKQFPRHGLKAALKQHLPERLADVLAKKLNPQAANLADIKDGELSKLEQRLSNWTFAPTGTEGFAKAEVTIGGVSTNELSSKTMESKSVSGLYFIGECVDVTGWLGGYNFQWAWSSGVVAGRAIAASWN